MEYCGSGKDRIKQEATFLCNHFAQKDMEEWQEHVALATSSDSFFSIPAVHDKCIAEFHTDSESLIKHHKTVRDTTVASAYHRLKSDDDVIRAIEDLESLSQTRLPITGSKVIKTRRN
jgi:hypothetical protein